MSSSADAEVVVIGGGVVGCAVTRAIAAAGAATVLIEAENELALGASGTNSGILHTGFDSHMGELETELILRSAELRDPALDRLGVQVLRCGAVLRPRDPQEAATVREVAAGARRSGVDVRLGEDGALEVPGEAVTDPVAYTAALAGEARAWGAGVITGDPVAAIARRGEGLRVVTAAGERVACRAAVNCAGLRADEVARMVGDESFEIYPRKGEFFVFEPPGGRPLGRIHLPVPTARTKGVLVFPTIDGKVVAGPTAHDQEDKDDWSVREGAFDDVMPKAVAMVPELEGAEPIASYAGLRPAGRGSNYVIGRSQACPALVNVAAIRSTGLTASLGIAERVVSLVAETGVAIEAEVREAPAVAPPEPAGEPWWLRAARRGATA